MKNAACITGVLALFMLVPLFSTFIGAGFNEGPSEKTYFSEAQINEICEQLQFDLAPGETLTTRFWPGILQAEPWLGVYIHGIESEAAFLSRFRGKIVDDDSIELFIFDGIKPEGYGSQLGFSEIEGVKTAQFYIMGYVPQLSNIYEFVYNPYQAFLSYRPFMTCLVLEITIVLLLIVQIVIIVIRQKENDKIIQL